MLSINNVFKILGSFVYMESTDLKDAFVFYTYTFYGSKISKIYILLFISIISYIKWIWTCYKNNEISKVSFGYLKSLGHNSVLYVDDSYLQRETYHACPDNISDTIKLLRELGSVIQTEKSVFTPSQIIVFLGFNISSKIWYCH